MIPEHRLGTLLGQIKQSQISKCLYHNPSTAPSLFIDHMCDRTQFPLQTIVELTQSEGEVWFVEFSHNGKRLAASGEDNTVAIYDTSNFQVRHTLREHTEGVVLVAWSPDDTKLITCSKDRTAKVWDMDVSFTLARHSVKEELTSKTDRKTCIGYQPPREGCDGCLLDARRAIIYHGITRQRISVMPVDLGWPVFIQLGN